MRRDDHETELLPGADADVSPRPRTRPSPRPWPKRLMHVIRRGHLYLGLFLFPWAILYGVTAFLFNHPTAFSEQATTTFGIHTTTGTPLDDLPTPNEQADEVIWILNEQQKPSSPYTRAGDAQYVREFAFATVRGTDSTTSVLIDVKNGGGTIRANPPEPVRKPVDRAPFVVGRTTEAPIRGGRGSGPRSEATGGEGIKLARPMPDRVKAAVPTILERLGWAVGEVSVTSVPELSFPIQADGQVWTATYNGMTGTITGKKTETEVRPELSVRRFLLRLHTAHGYPGETNARWFWAVIVDIMAGVMCFWGISGLLMWWQIQATRRTGFLILVLSAIAATALGIGMHAAMTG